MKKLVYIVIGGCLLGTSMSHAQTISGAKDKEIGEIRVWDCECSYSGVTCQEEHQKAAINLRVRFSQMSSIHWKLGIITASPDVATFSIGVYEGSRVPEIQEILEIGSATVGCGELVARHTF